MIAVDTNVVVRLLTNDEPRQARRAANLFRREEVLLPRTVLLECEWVLRHAYGIGREVIAEAFRKLLGLPSVSVEGPEVVTQALAWFDEGLDFADALHLAAAREGGASGFATFDRTFARRAGRHAGIAVVQP